MGDHPLRTTTAAEYRRRLFLPRRRPPPPPEPVAPAADGPVHVVPHWRDLLAVLVDLPDGQMLAVESTGRWEPEELQKLLHAELTRRPGLLGARWLRTRLAEHGAVWVWCDPVGRDAPRGAPARIIPACRSLA